MNYEQMQKLSGEDFRRLTGVKRETFLMMAEILMQEYEIAKKNHKYRGGRKPALSIENSILLVFTYLREYSSMFHTAQKFGVSEMLGWNVLKFIENTLIKNKNFPLSSKRELLKNGTHFATNCDLQSDKTHNLHERRARKTP